MVNHNPSQQKNPFIPQALIDFLTSKKMFGTDDYLIATEKGTPLQDETPTGSIGYTDIALTDELHFTSRIVHSDISERDSQWVDEEKRPLYKAGTPTRTISFAVTNVTTKPVNVTNMFIKAWYDDSTWLACPVTPSQNAAHLKLGYPEHLIDLFPVYGEWVIQPNQSIVFAETFYDAEDNHTLNLRLIIPEESGTLITSQPFSLVW